MPPDDRRMDRSQIELKTIVQVKENDQETWKEVTKVTTVSRNGAGFSLTKPVGVGRLVTLVMPLDPALRAYDQNENVYPVMGLVQYCNKGMTDGQPVFHVGVGFIGKRLPESFKTDPAQSYRITGMTKDGLWTITEANTAFKDRRHPRFWLSLGVTVTLIKKDKSAVTKEDAVTQNIGASGVSVVCSLNAEVGEKVKFACKSMDFYAIAVVRNQKTSKDKVRTLHLEFVDTLFPVEKLMSLPAEPSVAHAASEPSSVNRWEPVAAVDHQSIEF